MKPSDTVVAENRHHIRRRLSPHRPAIESLEDRRLFSAGLVPALVKNSVPAQVVAGAAFKSSMSFRLTDTSEGAETGVYTVDVFASTSTTVDPSVDAMLKGVTRPRASITPGKSATVIVPIGSVPASLGAGTFHLLVRTIDSTGNVVDADTGATVTVAAPFVSLSETVTANLPAVLIGTTATHGSVTVSITNGGNAVSAGVTPVDVTFSTVAGRPGTFLANKTVNLSIKPGKTARVVLPIKLLPQFDDGNLYLTAEVIDPVQGYVTFGSTKSTLAVKAGVVSLSAGIGPVGKPSGGAVVTVTNSGNIADVTTLHYTLGFSTDPAGSQPVGGTVVVDSKLLHIGAKKNVRIRLDQWGSILPSIAAGVRYFVTVLVSDDTHDSTSSVSAMAFEV